MIGTKLAHYEITSHLGTGGMGEVYKATDSKLGRSVAIKRLPAAFASDPDHLSRFRREAQVLASLNHPNIAHVYGLEESGETRCIVMELVEGETLQERIKQGPVPVTEALTIAKQIVAALEAAHEKGVVHRDLKPGNVMLTSDGRVKVLDFGLAKAYDANPTSGISANSPTLASMAATNAGVILGTAAYMAPEQARGKVVDKRADVWAFGCVLFEMLTGRHAFEGATVTDTLARVLEREPDWSALPARTPPAIVRLLRRSLRKDTRNRLHDIADAMRDGQIHLFLRPLNSDQTRELAGTDGALYPFWSPDSRFIAFFASGKLKKLSLADDIVTDIATGIINGRGGSWSKDDVILFAPDYFTTIKKVSAGGGKVTDATTLDPARGERTNRFPWFLPDGRHFLYTAQRPAGFYNRSTVRLGSLDSSGSAVLFDADSNVMYASGFLLYLRENSATLVARPFDLA